MVTQEVDSCSINGRNGEEKIALDPVRVNSGDGVYSYNKNSIYQRLAANAVNEKVVDVITRKLDINGFLSCSKVIRLADLGCAVGPNTIIAMEHIMEVIEKTHKSQNLKSSKFLEFHVFFNDKTSNDFNTLFASFPKNRPYFAAGVPGCFHQRLFPQSSMHFMYSSYALHWLSQVPEELMDNNSLAWNKGRVHYSSAPTEVIKAYEFQFAKDMENFLNARADELVTGGMMVIIMPGVPFGMPYSQLTNGVMYDLIGSCFMDMAKEGLIKEDQIDSFNLPVYAPTPEEIISLVERNGCFSIERLELTSPSPWLKGPVDIPEFVMHVRAAMEGMFIEHFAIDIVDKMFDRLTKKLVKFSDLVESSYKGKTMLFVVIIRK